MPRTSESVVAELVDRNMRLTGPRLEIINYVTQKQRTFSAEEVCADLPQIGRSTVYRSLKLLQDERIICKIVTPQNQMVYSVSIDAPTPPSTSGESESNHHHHAVCTVCGEVRRFNAAAIENAIAALSTSEDGGLGVVMDHRIEVYDVCPCCCGDTAE